MCKRPLILLLMSVGLFALVWRLGHGWSLPQRVSPRPAVLTAIQQDAGPPGRGEAPPSEATVFSSAPYRLSNTPKTTGQLVRNDKAILLENALLDTQEPLALPIPHSFRAVGDPGSYIVQSRVALDDHFRSFLSRAGATIVSYIPNNAYLVRASAGVAQKLASAPQTQVVIPYEPYYKLKASLLKLVLVNTPLQWGDGGQTEKENRFNGLAKAEKTVETVEAWGASSDTSLKGGANGNPINLIVLLFPDARESTLAALQSRGVTLLSEEPSPFGPRLRLQAPAALLPALAGLSGVQELEPAPSRVPANDLSRATLGTAADSVTPENYLGLTGSNVLINLNDTGVDATQPDLVGRVAFDVPASGMDANGHGTHVAGIIVGSGAQSAALATVPGSVSPTTEFQFRGQAPAARLFSISVGLDAGSPASDAYLQAAAVRTNAFISNNSWHYAEAYGYDSAAASYDAAVRDALPSVPGAQPLLYVFAAGNAGAGNDDGTGGNPDSIQSPATAKNVITVGASELPRFLTNQTWNCTPPGQTNQPWLGLTDSSNQVAAFSSRGNVGVGIEGDFGRFKPDLVAPGTFVVSTCSAQWDQAAYYNLSNLPFGGAPDPNYFQVLSNLNRGLAPFYRYESGTSLAAGQVAGTLALMQEFFEQRLGRTNSPALMKALLLNGARSAAGLYDFHVDTTTNFQGWGLVHLPSSLPASLTNGWAGSNAMFLFDQDPQEALATGQSRTRFFSVSAAARRQPLRVTLVWTDPPGNPMAGLKLVNDLDLVLTNLDTGEVFLGNDISAGQQFNQPWNREAAPNRDVVNNVENVYLAPSLGTNYSVTVVGSRVNVNAVSASTNGVLQDYALVVGSGDGQLADALTLTDGPFVDQPAATVDSPTNSVFSSPGQWGVLLSHQRAGTIAPDQTNTVGFADATGSLLTLGQTNQWRFYAVTNESDYTNAAFLTFLPVSLSLLPVAGANGSTNLAAPEPDLDLYVSRDPALTNLDAAALAAADRSTNRGGAETIVYSNASPGVYYIAIKSESPQAVEYNFLAAFSELPFAETDSQGNLSLRGFPVGAPIPGGSAAQPGTAFVLALAPEPLTVRRVVVTNTLTCAALSDLTGTLTHDGFSVVLNHSASNASVANQTFIYDDSGEGDIPGAQPVDGPGSLRTFAGRPGFGQWLLTITSTNQPGTNNSLLIFLERQSDLSWGNSVTVLPGVCHEDFVTVPPGATNLSAVISLDNGDGPLSAELAAAGTSFGNGPILQLPASGARGSLVLDKTSHPPLNPGLYVLRLCNSGATPVAATLNVSSSVDPNVPARVTVTAAVPTPIADDALSVAGLLVTNAQRIVSVEAGVRLEHPRVSDLALALVSPAGTRVWLEANRGGLSTNGLGMDMPRANLAPVTVDGGAAETSNTFDIGQTSGTIHVDYNFRAEPDDMKIYYESNLLFDSGLVSGTNTVDVAFGPGHVTSVSILMNQGGNSNPDTVWYYTLSSTRLDPLYLGFSDDTNRALLPIKFAPPPLTNVTANGVFFQPEESLGKFAGELAAGQWRLEIWDARAGALLPPPRLVSWQLSFQFADMVPAPVALLHGHAVTNTLPGGQLQWYAVDVPAWAAFATNWLRSASAPVNLWFNPSQVPTGTNAADLPLLGNAAAGSITLQTNGLPPLTPGLRYYLGVQNTNAVPVTFGFEVDFDIAPLTQGVPVVDTIAAGSTPRYFAYEVSSNAVAVAFQLTNLTGNATLVARAGLPLPTLTSFDFSSFSAGSNSQNLVVTTASTPVPLAPGRWYLGVFNSDAVPVSYALVATELAAGSTNAVLIAQDDGNGSRCLTWLSLPASLYYLQGKTNQDDAAWAVLSPTLTAADCQTTFCLPLPCPFAVFQVQQGLAPQLPAPPISNIQCETNGVWLHWQAPDYPLSRFRVQYSPSLTEPSWTTFFTIPSSTNGDYLFLDDGSETGGFDGLRFYRLLQLP